MTVTAAEARVEYAGNGTTTVFAYPYQFFQNDDLNVWLFDNATSLGVQQALGTDYTLTGALNPSGGSVHMTVAPPTGTTLIIINNPDIVQTLHYVNADDFPADSHEQGLDRLTKICQRLSDRVDRAVRAPDYAPEDQVPDAATLVSLVEEAQVSADNAELSAGSAQTSANNAASSAATAVTAANSATGSASAAATSATNAHTSEVNAAASAATAVVNQISWRGSWSASTPYAIYDAVSFSGASYIAKVANTNFQPDTNPAKWDVLSAQGNPGPAGSGAGDMLRSLNLSDVLNPATARTNLGLGGAAVLNVGTVASTVAAGDDSRFASLVAVDATKAPLISPALTGNPTAPTASPGDNDTSIATTAFVHDAVIAGAPVAATSAEYLANSAPSKMLTPGAIWAAAAQVTLTDAATVTPNLSLGSDFVWTPGAAGRTLANPTNGKPGQKGLIILVGASGKLAKWGSSYKFPAATKPTLTTGVDILSYVVGNDSVTMFCTAGTGFG